MGSYILKLISYFENVDIVVMIWYSLIFLKIGEVNKKKSEYLYCHSNKLSLYFALSRPTSNSSLRHTNWLNFFRANAIMSDIASLGNVVYVLRKGREINDIFVKNKIE